MFQYAFAKSLQKNFIEKKKLLLITQKVNMKTN